MTLCLDIGSFQYKAEFGGERRRYPARYARAKHFLIGDAFEALPLGARADELQPFSGPFLLNHEVFRA